MLGFGLVGSQSNIAGRNDNQAAIFAANDRQRARADSPIIDYYGAKADELTRVAFGAQNLAYDAMKEQNQNGPSNWAKSFRGIRLDAPA